MGYTLAWYGLDGHDGINEAIDGWILSDDGMEKCKAMFFDIWWYEWPEEYEIT